MKLKWNPFYKFNLLRLILFPVTETIFSKRYFNGKNGVLKLKKFIVKMKINKKKKLIKTIQKTNNTNSYKLIYNK